MFSFFKKKEISIVCKDELIICMTRIVEILRDSGYSAQADAVQKPLGYLYIDDKDNFVKNLLTNDIWGGSGAAWEVGFFSSKEFEIEFGKCFIELVSLMKRCGIDSPRTNQVAKGFM